MCRGSHRLGRLVQRDEQLDAAAVADVEVALEISERDPLADEVGEALVEGSENLRADDVVIGELRSQPVDEQVARERRGRRWWRGLRRRRRRRGRSRRVGRVAGGGCHPSCCRRLHCRGRPRKRAVRQRVCRRPLGGHGLDGRGTPERVVPVVVEWLATVVINVEGVVHRINDDLGFLDDEPVLNEVADVLVPFEGLGPFGVEERVQRELCAIPTGGGG